jgi:Domain of unknown function (DUF4287)
MSFQAYLDNITTKTGKSADDFRQLAAKKVTWKMANFDPASKPGRSSNGSKRYLA